MKLDRQSIVTSVRSDVKIFVARLEGYLTTGQRSPAVVSVVKLSLLLSCQSWAVTSVESVRK